MLQEPCQTVGEPLPLGLIERRGRGLLVLQQTRDQFVIDVSTFGREMRADAAAVGAPVGGVAVTLDLAVALEDSGHGGRW
jgi:hypothetical protein